MKCGIFLCHFEGKRNILFSNLVEMYTNFFVEMKSEFSVPFQVGEEKAFVDVNKNNCISLKCCRIRTAMLCWSFVSFPFSLRVRGRRIWWRAHRSPFLTPSSFPFSEIFHGQCYSKAIYLPNRGLVHFLLVSILLLFIPSKSGCLFLIWCGCLCVSVIFPWPESWFLDLDWYFFLCFFSLVIPKISLFSWPNS